MYWMTSAAIETMWVAPSSRTRASAVIMMSLSSTSVADPRARGVPVSSYHRLSLSTMPAAGSFSPTSWKTCSMASPAASYTLSKPQV